MKKLFLLSVLSIVYVSMVFSNTIRVPQDSTSIQDAIDGAMTGDTVLVDTGVYYENVKFRGKDIVLTSYYVIRDDYNTIFNTIIDGSQPDDDTSHVVLFRNGETEAAVLEGFTIRNGVASIEAGDAGIDGDFPGGGGIHIYQASPEIKFNFITNNSSGQPGLSGAGGAIANFSNSHVHNNIFYKNIGDWGSAFVENWSSVTFNNNLVVGNISTSQWGTTLIFYNNDDEAEVYDTNVVTNNTVVGNITENQDRPIFGSSGKTVLHMRNNIIYGNFSPNDVQITIGDEVSLDMAFNLLPESDWVAGNISERPVFRSDSFFLADHSPGVDDGDTNVAHNDREHPDIADEPLFPAQGSLRNDMGFTGGPGASSFTMPVNQRFYTLNDYLTLTDTVGQLTEGTIALYNLGLDSLTINDVTSGSEALMFSWTANSLPQLRDTVLTIEWNVEEGGLEDSVMIYHNDTTIANPFVINFTGNAIVPDEPDQINNTEDMAVSVYPNPAREYLFVQFGDPASGTVALFDQTGRQVMIADVVDRPHIKLDTYHFKSGVYILNVSTTNGIINRKILINKVSDIR